MVEESHAIHSGEGDRWGEAQAVGTLGAIARDTGDPSRAYELLSRSAALSHEISVQWWEAGMLAELAAPALDAGRVDEAESQATHALVLAAEVRDRAGLIFGVGLLAGVAATRRRCHLARRLWSAVEHADALAPLGGWRHHRERYAPRLAQCAAMQDDDSAPATLDEAVTLILCESPRR